MAAFAVSLRSATAVNRLASHQGHRPRNFSRSYDLRIAKARVRRITVHDARRTCGSLLADLDVHPRATVQILRHARFSITMEIYARFSITMEIYTRVSSDRTRDALKRLGESLDRQ
jgi:integrase